MKKYLAMLLSLVMVAGLMTGCGDTTPPAAAGGSAAAGDAGATAIEPQVWKFACSATETSTWVEAAKEFGRMMEEDTNGAITVQYFAADQLSNGSQTDGIQMLMDGTTELSMHSNLIYSSFNDKFNVVSLPFLFANTEEADAKLDGAGGDALAAILEDEMGLHLLGIAENGFRHVTNSKHPIVTPADMAGLKLRVASSSLLNDSYKAWGADYANANWSEVFTALQTGTYDGQENPLPTADAASIQEVQKYLTYWTGSYDCLFFCMNKELYDSLSPELQAIVDKNGQAAAEYEREVNRGQDETIMAKWEEAGVEIHELTEEEAKAFKALSDPLYAQYEDVLTPELIAAFTGK